MNKFETVEKRVLLDENDNCAVFYVQQGFSESKIKELYLKVKEDILMDEIVNESEISRIYLTVMTEYMITDLIPISVIRNINELFNELSDVCKEELEKHRNEILMNLIKHDSLFKKLLIANIFEEILMNLKGKLKLNDINIFFITLNLLKTNKDKGENVRVLYEALHKSISKISL